MTVKQNYILRKQVTAESIEEALRLDKKTRVSEVFLSDDKPSRERTSAIGFQMFSGDER